MSRNATVTTICWWSPWFRSLARNYIKIWRGDNSRVHLLTSDAHLDKSLEPIEWETCIPMSRSWRSKPWHFLRTCSTLIKIRPDVVIADEPGSPYNAILLILAAIWRPMALIIHDAQPHDAANRLGRFTELLRRLLFARVRLFVAMSPYTERMLRSLGFGETVALPLLPEAPGYLHSEPAHARRHFAMIGRWSEYKGFDVGLEIYKRFAELHIADEQLHVWASGAPALLDLPAGVVLRASSSFSWSALMRELPGYRGVLMPYRNGSQSGVQVLAWSVGVPAIVSDIPGLVQFQPRELPAIPSNDESLWVAAMSNLMNDETLHALAEAGRKTTLERLDADAITQALDALVSKTRSH